MNCDKGTIRTLWWCLSLLSFGLAFALYIIVLQDDVIDQKIYDLNVSQTALMIQKAEYKELNQKIADGLCLKRLN